MNKKWTIYWNLTIPTLKAMGKWLGLITLAYLLLANLFQSLLHLITGMPLTDFIFYMIAGFLGCVIVFLGCWLFESIRCMKVISRITQFAERYPTPVEACRQYLKNHSLEDTCKIFQKEACKKAVKDLIQNRKEEDL